MPRKVVIAHLHQSDSANSVALPICQSPKEMLEAAVVVGLKDVQIEG